MEQDNNIVLIGNNIINVTQNYNKKGTVHKIEI